MDKNSIVSESININASAEKIWTVLTDPEKIKIYLYDTNTETTWEVGASIKFYGEYRGVSYSDKGEVLEHFPNKILRYSYWAEFSGLEDTAENYSEIIYKLVPISESEHELTWTQIGFVNSNEKNFLENTLKDILAYIKKIVE